MKDENQGTEQRIKDAAKGLFQKKGFAATKTREIAEASETNLALVNYYFRTKKQLFDAIMLETLNELLSGVVNIYSNEETTFEEKINAFVNHYMDLFSENQNLPAFIMNSVRENPKEYLTQFGLLGKIQDSTFAKQFQEKLEKGEIAQVNPINFIVNLIALTVFPFITQPIVCETTGINKELYYQMIEDRRRLIPLWIETMLRIT
ncbi:MAG: TetR/AcrR family transcriptional regulator [Bacteroidota bacterium]